MHRLAVMAALLLVGCDLGGPAPGGGPSGSLPAGSCGAKSFLAGLGKDHLLIGMSGTDASAAAAPYDLRYQYISGGIPDGGGPCQRCDPTCLATDHGQNPPRTASCDNASGGCAWWGCWQWDQDPPGAFARAFRDGAATRSEIPMFTYYELLQSMPSPSEGDAEVQVVADRAFMARYLADYRFLLQQIGDTTAFVHVEPDFWGYAAQRGVACSAIPAAVATANPTDCAGQPETLAGLGGCFISMARKYAPHARVGLHASGWGTRIDVLQNGDPALDLAAEAKKLGEFLAACGAGAGDFIAADMSDRDAGWYASQGRDTWWDATNATLPNFHQAFAWASGVAQAVGLPVLWWQVPVGNLQLAATNRDNRLDYAFQHQDELAASGALGIAFGAGAAGQATPENDGGHLAAQVRARAAAGAGSCR